MLKNDEHESECGFVIFNSIKDRDQVLKEYSNIYKWWRYILCCMWKDKANIPVKYQIDGQFPCKVRETESPSNLNWENLDCSPFERFVRKMVSYFFIFLLMCV